MGARRVTRAAARSRAGRLARFLLASGLAASFLARASPAGARDVALPPEPELSVPAGASEKEIEALPSGDAGRVRLLVALALRRHAESVQVERQEDRDRGAGATAIGAGGGDVTSISEPEPDPAARATPHADALRAEVVSFALRAAEEGPASPELPDALIVGGLDADRIGRGADAVRLLGILVRRHADSPHVGDAWLALGERHLRSGDLTRARAALEQAERVGRPAVRAWAAARRVELERAVSLPAR